MLEVARVAAAGFPTRYRLEDFAARYSTLLTAEEQEALKRTQGSAGPRQVGAMGCAWKALCLLEAC